MEAIILTGGRGTRLQKLIPNLPKGLAPVKEKPILSHIMDDLIDTGIKHFILSIGYLGDQIMSYYGNHYQNIPITYAFEKLPLGTGGAIIFAKQSLKTAEPTLIINGDTIQNINYFDFFDHHLNFDNELTVCLSEQEGDYDYFDLGFDFDGNFANSGLYIANRSFLDLISNSFKSTISFEKEIIPKLINKIQCSPFINLNSFFDIGTTEAYQKLNYQTHEKR